MEPVYIHRKKDYAPKTMSRNGSSGGASGTKKHRRKDAKHVAPLMRKRMILDLSLGGKIRWDWIPA